MVIILELLELGAENYKDKFDTFIEVADVQALTDNFNNPQKAKDNTLQIVMDLLALGIDPK